MESYYLVLPEPPYVLLAAGFLAAIASGSAFYTTLVQRVREWADQRSTRSLAELRGTSLFMPFLGISGGILFFLASGLEVFGFFPPFTYVISLVLTVATAGLVWYQLGRVLAQVEKGGFKSLDLDSFG
jgi:hypothetical protein